MRRTEEQVKIHEAMRDTSDNMLINAVAGSGKTTTAITGCPYLPRGSGMLAFNKSIALELESRIPDGMTASTFNALGFRFLRSRLPSGMKTNGYKSFELFDKHIGHPNPDVKRLVARLVSAAKNTGLGIQGFAPDEAEEWQDLMDNYDLVPGELDDISPEDVIHMAQKILRHNEDDYKIVDFDDQLYLSLKLMIERGWKAPQFPVLIVDESQDTNAVQAELIARFCDRSIKIGDRFQAIYGFRGAGVSSMEDLKERFGSVEYDLSRTFRCANNIVDLAQRVNPAIRARDDAPDGIVRQGLEWESIVENVSGTDLVICRNNFPLVKIALKLLAFNIPFSMSGSYPQQLIAFVKGFKAEHLQMFRVRLKDWWEARKEELEKLEKFGVLAREEDKFNSLWELQASSTSVEELIQKLEFMTMNRNGIRLATIHSSKGLESDKVHFIMPELLPSKYATKAWQLQQEDNLYYVGVTRAKTELSFYKGE